MGARLARAANVVDAGKLPLATRRVLVAMALRALDSPRGDTPAATYFGGHHRLLADLGVMPTRTTERHLKAHLRALTNARLIVQTQAPAPGKRAVYELRVPVDNLPP